MRRHFLFFLLMLGLSACGPVASTVHLSDAKQALDEALRVSANELSPYEYAMALEYFNKADEKENHADFNAAIVFADLSLKYAHDAANKAKDSPKVKDTQKVETKESLEVQNTNKENPNEGLGR